MGKKSRLGNLTHSQGHDLAVAGTDNDGGDGAVKMSGVSVGVLNAGAVLALDILGLGGEIPGAVQGDEAGVPDRAHGLEQPVFIEGPVQVVKEIEEVVRPHRVERLADVVVGGDAPDLEEGAGVVLSPVLFHELLEAQEGGSLGEEDREGRERDVGQGEAGVFARAPVGQPGGDGAQASDEPVKVVRVHGVKQCPKAVQGTSYNFVTIATDV